MKTAIAFLLISTTFQQFASPDLSKDFGDAVDNLKDNIKADIEKDRQKVKQQKMDEFIEETKDLLNEHKDLTKIVKIGEFQIKINSSCKLELPEPPVIEFPPVELECI